MKFYSYKEWGEGTTSFWVVLTRGLEVLSILVGGGGRKKFLLFRRGGGRKEFYPVLRGWGRKMFWTRDFPILWPPSPSPVP